MVLSVLCLPNKPLTNELAIPKAPPTRAPGTPPAAAPAAASFASKCGISVDEILFKDFGKGEVLYHKQKISGAFSKELLNNMVNEFVASLNFGKSMRWGDIVTGKQIGRAHV